MKDTYEKNQAAPMQASRPPIIIREEFTHMAYQHLIDKNRCKGCGVCVSVCPKNVLAISNEVNAKGYFPAYQARPEDCIFCAICCTMCPDVAITISQLEEEAAGQPEMEAKDE